ncbi:MAG: non-canonical purine NTP pyrophosphatase [Shimia sp.]
MSRRLVEPRLCLASHNAGKLREIAALLAPHGIDVVSAGELGLPEPEETETTFAGNARLKAHAAVAGSGLPALSDDSGLAVDALGGAPGVHTADWAETPEGRDFAMAMGKVRDRLGEAPQPWTATFHCTLCLAWPDGEDAVFAGTAPGSLTWPPRGDKGFGFDPMFVPEGHVVTFGEMEPDAKQPLTHRAAAFALFEAQCLPRR